jgi:hypothetical protein
MRPKPLKCNEPDCDESDESDKRVSERFVMNQKGHKSAATEGRASSDSGRVFSSRSFRSKSSSV